MNNKQVRLVPLAELITSAKSGFACGETEPAGVAQVRMNNVTTSGSWDFTQIRRIPVNGKQIEGFLLRPGDVLFNATNSPDLVGKTAHFAGFREPLVFSNHFIRIRVNAQILCPSYLARWLTLKRNEGLFEQRCTQWVNQASFRKDDLLSLPVPLLPLEQQKRITTILDKADEIRRKRQESLRVIDELLRSVFLDMFGDPLRNPREWKQVALAELGSLDRGVSKHRPRNAPELLTGPYPFLQTGDVANSGGYIRRHSSTYSELGLKQSKLWPAGTLCITIAANIASTGILTYDACFPDSVVGFTANQTATVEFVQALLGFLRQLVEEKATQVAQRNINLKVLRELVVPQPPLQLQRTFSDIVRQALIGKEKAMLSLIELDRLFSVLQNHAFSGHL